MRTWFPEAYDEFNIVSIYEVLVDYIKTGRIKINKEKFANHTVTLHHPCNYFRKSKAAFDKEYTEEYRYIVEQFFDKKNIIDMHPNALNNHCCGAGGGAWASPYSEERLIYGQVKADQIRDTGAEIVVAPCHNCRDQIMKGLTPKFDMGNCKETLYLWEMVAQALIIEPWSDEEVKKAHALRDAQFERDGIELDEEE